MSSVEFLELGKTPLKKIEIKKEELPCKKEEYSIGSCVLLLCGIGIGAALALGIGVYMFYHYTPQNILQSYADIIATKLNNIISTHYGCR